MKNFHSHFFLFFTGKVLNKNGFFVYFHLNRRFCSNLSFENPKISGFDFFYVSFPTFPFCSECNKCLFCCVFFPPHFFIFLFHSVTFQNFPNFGSYRVSESHLHFSFCRSVTCFQLTPLFGGKIVEHFCPALSLAYK